MAVRSPRIGWLSMALPPAGRISAARRGPEIARRTGMNPTKNDLPEKIRKKSVELLNARLADVIDLQTQMKQAHWNIKGPHFIGLHKLFDEINETVEEYVDMIAERAVQLGGIAKGTSRVVANCSKLPEYPLDITAGEDHVDAVSTALAAFGKEVRAAIDQAEEIKD